MSHATPLTEIVHPYRIFDGSKEDGRQGRGQQGGEDGSPTSISAEMTLSEFYLNCFAPLWIGAQQLANATRTSYDESVDWWKKLTDDPPLSQIDEYTGATFTQRLSRQEGRKGEKMAVGTVRKHIGQLNAILDFSGPQQGRPRPNRPTNRNLLDTAPLMLRPRADQDPPDGGFALAEIHAIYRACDAMQHPRDVDGVTAPDWWRAMIVLGYYTGLRRSALMGLAWEDLLGDWIRSRSQRGAKRRKGIKQFVAVAARQHLEKIRGSRELIFPWPGWPNDSAKRRLHDCFERLDRAASLPKHRRMKFQALRQCHLTLLAEGGWSPDLAIAVAQRSAGHSTPGVTRQHYVSGTAQERMLAAAIENMPSPIPEGFSPGARQMRLF